MATGTEPDVEPLTQVAFVRQHQPAAAAVVLVSAGARAVGQQAHRRAEEQVVVGDVRLACSARVANRGGAQRGKGGRRGLAAWLQLGIATAARGSSVARQPVLAAIEKIK